jgi:hypothetical protein
MRDIDIRIALRRHELLHCGEPDTRVVEELGLCQGTARIDIAVVNGSIHGYEIKSAYDTLMRLPGQIEIYSRALDFVTIVTAETHADKVRTAVPEWWGLWVTLCSASKSPFEILREARQNIDVQPIALAQLLWREEALRALEDRNLATGMRGKPRQQMWRVLAAELPLQDLSAIVRKTLKLRGSNWRPGGPQA